MTMDTISRHTAQAALGAAAVTDQLQTVLGLALLALTVASAAIECWRKVRSRRSRREPFKLF